MPKDKMSSFVVFATAKRRMQATADEDISVGNLPTLSSTLNEANYVMHHCSNGLTCAVGEGVIYTLTDCVGERADVFTQSEGVAVGVDVFSDSFVEGVDRFADDVAGCCFRRWGSEWCYWRTFS